MKRLFHVCLFLALFLGLTGFSAPGAAPQTPVSSSGGDFRINLPMVGSPTTAPGSSSGGDFRIVLPLIDFH